MGTSPFTRVVAGSVAGLLVVGAIGAAGCGGGSSSSTTTVASTTTSTSQGAGPKSVPPSTAIGSTTYFNALVQAFTTNGQMSSSQAQSAAHCVQAGLIKAGFKTQGDAEGKNTKKALQVALPCIQKAKSQ